MQLHQPAVLKELEKLEAHLLVISFAPLPRLQQWVPFFRDNLLEPYYTEQGWRFDSSVLARTRFVADLAHTVYLGEAPKAEQADKKPDWKTVSALSVYHAYGLGRNSLLKVYGPHIMWQYAKWAVQGKPLKLPPEDPLQRGGNFVVGRDMRLTFSYVGRDQSDRPPVGAIVAALRRA